MTKSPLLLTPLLLTVAMASLLTACNKPVEAPAAPVEAAPAEVAAAVPETAPAALPTDHTTAAQAAEAEKAAAAAGVPATKQLRTTFQCDNDETIEVRFFPDQGIAVLVRGGQNTELQQQRTADGFEYSNGQTSIRGKGDELMLNVGMMATTKCKAKAG